MRVDILPRIQKDEVKSAIRYDDLIIYYGHDVCKRLCGEKYVQSIFVYLRKFGRLKRFLNMKKFPKIIYLDSKIVVTVIEKLALPAQDDFNNRSTFKSQLWPKTTILSLKKF